MENEIQEHLDELQQTIRPHLTRVLEGEVSESNIFRWDSSTNIDFEYAINPFTRTRNYLRELQQEFSDDSYRAELRASGMLPESLAASLQEVAEQVCSSQEVDRLETVYRRTNGYLCFLEKLTRFNGRYDHNPPREQGEEDLRRLRASSRGYVPIRIGGESDQNYRDRVARMDRPTFSPQFFLPIDEQVRNYETLRAILVDVADAEFQLTEETLAERLGQLYNEHVQGALFFMCGARSFPSSRQGVARYNSDTLALPRELIDRYLRSEINSYSLSERERTGSFLEREARYWAVPK